MKIEIGRTLNNAVNLHKQHGASLLEGIAYLGIAALVVLGAVSLLTNASASAQANQTAEELVALRTSVKKLYAGQGYPTTTTSMVKTLIKANAIPSTLTSDKTGFTLTNTWGGGVTVDGTTAGTFTIVYKNMPKEVCVNALSGMTGWQSVREGTAGKQITVFPMTTTDATDVCANDKNDVSFVSG